MIGSGRARRFMRRDSGQSLAEFALVVPVLLFLLVGIIEFSRGWMVQQVITNVAREGARLAVIPSSTAQQVQSRIDSLLSQAGIAPTAAHVSLNLCNGFGCAGTPDVVSINIPYQLSLLRPIAGLVCGGGACGSGGAITLRAVSRMRNE